MGSDISRHRFDPQRRYSAVLMQQGRVQLDADWNESVEILARRARSHAVDIIGRAGVPRETPDGFLIELDAGQLTIGPGRLYAGGLLAENFGSETGFDPVLAELRGTQSIPFEEQPFGINSTDTAPSSPAPHLVYIDVWQREVTWLQDPSLIESAIGADTTSRLQTVWQVRILPDIGQNITCETPDDQIPGWLDLIQPSAARLSTSIAEIEESDDPCLIPPTGGYQGLENRLYRIEIHNVAPDGSATFKWARHNASIATIVRQISGTQVVVDLIGRDADLRFHIGDWVEITDDRRELDGIPGILRNIADIADETRTITLDQPLTPSDFPVDGSNAPDPERHTRIRRWDQRGNLAPTGGAIPVPPDNTPVMLEDRIQVAFSRQPANGRFRAGDFWTFAARTADASIEKLENAHPRGIHHHYCRLAIITSPTTTTDCRPMYPPLPTGLGESGLTRIAATSWKHNENEPDLFPILEQDRRTPAGIGFVIAFTQPVILPPIGAEHIFEVLIRVPHAAQRTPELSPFNIFQCWCPLLTGFDSSGQPLGMIRAVNCELQDQSIARAVITTDRAANGIAFILPPGSPALALINERTFFNDFRIRLRCDFVLDQKGRAVDGEHARALLPSGDRPANNPRGIQGGTFESWFRFRGRFRAGMILPEIIVRTGAGQLPQLRAAVLSLWQKGAIQMPVLHAAVDGRPAQLMAAEPELDVLSDHRYDLRYSIHSLAIPLQRHQIEITWETPDRVSHIPNTRHGPARLQARITWDGRSNLGPIITDHSLDPPRLSPNLAPIVTRGRVFRDRFAFLAQNTVVEDSVSTSFIAPPPGLQINPDGTMQIPAPDTARYTDNPINNGADFAFSGILRTTAHGENRIETAFEGLFDGTEANP